MFLYSCYPSFCGSRLLSIYRPICSPASDWLVGYSFVRYFTGYKFIAVTWTKPRSAEANCIIMSSASQEFFLDGSSFSLPAFSLKSVGQLRVLRCGSSCQVEACTASYASRACRRRERSSSRSTFLRIGSTRTTCVQGHDDNPDTCFFYVRSLLNIARPLTVA